MQAGTARREECRGWAHLEVHGDAAADFGVSHLDDGLKRAHGAQGRLPRRITLRAQHPGAGACAGWDAR